MQTVMVVYGTRPEAIKMAPVATALRARPDRFRTIVCATAQHREMMDQVQEVFDLTPDIDLDLMRPAQTLNDLASRSLAAIDAVLVGERPDWVLVQGDTTTAMTVALAAFHREVQVGHVEAGLRTGDLKRPFPEEANRRLIDVFAEGLFAPTERSRRRLLDEGHDPGRVFLTGNTGIDALLSVAERIGGVTVSDEVLVTVHRRESFGAPIRAIFAAIRELAERFPELRFVYPVHRNPNVQGPAHEILGGLSNVALEDPFDYLELVRHLARARLVLSDSGGIQEEAPSFGKPVLVLRETTERPEGIDAGVARLVGADREGIVSEAVRLLTDDTAWRAMANATNPYGDGHAADRIVRILAGEPWQPFAPTQRGA